VWARSLSAFIHRRAIAILLVAAVLTGLAIIAASKVRLDQELRSLLPDDFPSVTRLDRLSTALGQQSDLYVTIRSPSREANIAFGNAVAERLAERDDIRYVVFRRDLEYFESHGLLYASLADLLDLRRRVIAKIREEVGKQAFGEFSEPDEKKTKPEDAAVDLGFDPDEVRAKYGLSEAYDEYMEADEGRLMVVKMRPLRPATDLEYARGLTGEVRALVEELDPASHHPEMTADLDGSYVQHQKRLQSVQDEVWGGTVAVIVALLVSLAIYFRSARALVLVFLPLLAAITGALAFAYIFHGALNLVSAFIFAVLAGLGIDFGIHMLARIRQERSRGLSTEEALAVTFETSGRTTIAGAVSTSLTFASLSVADFRGFSQFGQVASLGVMLALMFAFIVMPALLFAVDRIRPWRAPPPERGDATSLGRAGPVFRVVAIITAIAGIAFAVYGGSHIKDLEFEHDLKKLGRRGEEDPGPKRASYRDAVGTYQTVDPAVALVDDAEQAESIQRQLDGLLAMTPEEVAAFDPDHPPTRALPPPPKMLEDKLEEEIEEGEEEFDDEFDDFGDDDLEDPIFVALEKQAEAEALMSGATAQLLGRYDRDRLVVMRDRLAQVWSIHAFVPRLQDEKLQVIRDIRARIDAKKASLTDKTKTQVDEWYRYLSVDTPVHPHELPSWVTAQFEDVQQRPGRLVMVATRGSKAEIDNARQIYSVFGTVYTHEGEVDVAADFFVIPEIFEAIETDGPLVMGLAAAILLGAVFVLLRRIAGVIAVVITIAFALLWLAGIAHVLGWKLNFFNIIVMPLLLGMGEDDALHITERHYEEGGKLGRVLREAGGAIFMTTLTTVWGFSGILFANHRGLESMAWTAVVGMTLCLLAAVVILPVILALFRKTGLGGR
jgi:predicted RND superfamily exporter protein